jgi:hypothetical protein
MGWVRVRGQDSREGHSGGKETLYSSLRELGLSSSCIKKSVQQGYEIFTLPEVGYCGYIHK